jgi:hypothetical protein
MDWAVSNIENVDEDIFYVGSQKQFPPNQELFNLDDQRGIVIVSNVSQSVSITFVNSLKNVCPK